MKALRPSDLAREHGISAQAVRNYERDLFIPPADRTPSGYRIYTELHAAALRAYLALIPAYGYETSGRIMNALHADDLDTALALLDRGHSQLLRDRDTLDQVRDAVDHLTSQADDGRRGADPGARTIGELAHRLRLTPATLRSWERVGILAPARDAVTGHRIYRADDTRDAELAHLLRRGGYLLGHISTVVQQVRSAGGTDELASALDDWKRKLTAQGLAMLNAATLLDRYLSGPEGAAHRELAGLQGAAQRPGSRRTV